MADVSLVFALSRRIWPPPQGVSLADLRARRKKYLRFELLSTLAFFVIWAAFAVLIWFGLSGLARVVAARREPAAFAFTTGGIGWAVPAMFLGMFAAIVPVLLLTRLALRGEQYREFMYVGRYVLGFDAWWMLAALAALVIPAMVVLAGLMLDQYMLFTPTHVVVDPFFGLAEQRRPYAEVAGVYEIRKSAPPQGGSRRATYAVRFRDGTTWRSAHFARQPDRVSDAAAAHYAAERAGVPLQQVAALRD